MKKKFLWTIGLGAVAIISYIILISLYLPITDRLQKADAIVAVSGGDTRNRTLHATKLYQEGWAPKLVFAGAAADPSSASNAKVMLAIAASRGVPPDAISIEESSRDTKENAEKTKSVIGGAKKIILVTSDYHQRRVSREFKKAYGGNIQFINSPAKDKNWGRKSWFLTPYGWWISVTEPLKLLFTRATS